MAGQGSEDAGKTLEADWEPRSAGPGAREHPTRRRLQPWAGSGCAFQKVCSLWGLGEPSPAVVSGAACHWLSQ